jgi:hypothetical protein
MNPLTQGLFVSPQNVFLTFDFVGKETTFTNLAVSEGSTLFSNNVVPGPGSSVTNLFGAGPGGGLVPFLFQSTNYNPDRVATNGGTIDRSLGTAFSCVLRRFSTMAAAALTAIGTTWWCASPRQM